MNVFSRKKGVLSSVYRGTKPKQGPSRAKQRGSGSRIDFEEKREGVKRKAPRKVRSEGPHILLSKAVLLVIFS